MTGSGGWDTELDSEPCGSGREGEARVRKCGGWRLSRYMDNEDIRYTRRADSDRYFRYYRLRG